MDVSDENIYARNAAEDIAPTAETVAIDFGTKKHCSGMGGRRGLYRDCASWGIWFEG